MPEERHMRGFRSVRKTLENFVRTAVGMPAIADFAELPLSLLPTARLG
jgi:hypothetical protein